MEELQRRDVPSAVTPGSLSGYVYCDCNDNGVFDSGESPISNVTITVTGTEFLGGAKINQTTTTDANGFYSFPDLQPGYYTISETQPVGYGDGKDTQGTPGNGTTDNDTFIDIDLESGINGTDNNFGEMCPVSPPPPPPQTGCLSGVVYADCNNNGKFDNGESGLAGVTVTLTGPGGTRTATTDSTGHYSFTNLAPGTYTVTETQPTGYMQGTNTPGTPINGTVNGDVISGIAVTDTCLTNYNFGETSKDCGCDHEKPPKPGCDDHDKDCHTGCDDHHHHSGCDNDHDKDHRGCDNDRDHRPGCDDHHKPTGCDNDHKKDHRSCDNDHDKNNSRCDDRDHHSVCDNDKNHNSGCDNGKNNRPGCDNDKDHHVTCGDHDKKNRPGCDSGKDSHSGCDNNKDSHTVCNTGSNKDHNSGCDSGKDSHKSSCSPVKSLHC
jgi:hypothetical protein